MNQFNGYSSCPHCFIKGFWQNYRMLFSVTKPFKLRKNKDFKACGWAAERDGDIKCGIKSSTPLNSILDLPWDCPIDPMQVLRKVLVSLAKSKLKEANNLMMQVKLLFNILHRIKSLDEIKFWKAFDLKLFFFHVGPLVFGKIPVRRVFYKSFCVLSTAMRLLSEQTVTEAHIKSAAELITLFFSNFAELYGVDSQSFNFHTMRNLCEQVRRNGSLWLFSAFCFESANHNLLSAVQGTIKEL